MQLKYNNGASVPLNAEVMHPVFGVCKVAGVSYQTGVVSLRGEPDADGARGPWPVAPETIGMVLVE